MTRSCGPDEGGRRTWRAVRGDVFRWQVKVDLPLLSQAYIHSEYIEPAWRDDEDEEREHGPEEVGGDSDRIGPEQERALNYLVDNEAAVYAGVLQAVAAYARELRAEGGWDAFEDPPGIDAVMPRDMTPEQAAERIELTRVYVTPQSLDGMAYLQIAGECAWDPDHGFVVVLHGDRLVGVFEQGTGWVDTGAK